MYHSLTIGGKNTWDEWKLIPSARPDFGSPEPVTTLVDIPGRYEPLDLSETLTGHIMYSPREGTWNFYVFNDYPEYNWVKVRDSIMRHIHGKILDVIPEDDPDYFYRGRLTAEWASDENWSTVDIGYTLNPFKHPVKNPTNYENIKVNGSATLTVVGYDEYVVPSFKVETANDAGLYVGVDDRYIWLGEGTYTDPTLELGPGNHVMKFSGNGTVSVIYRGGLL